MTANRAPTILALLRGGLGNATPIAVTPGSAGAPGVATLGSRQDHNHPAPNVASGAQLTALETAVGPIVDDRRITVGGEITNATKTGAQAQACRFNATRSVLFVGGLGGAGPNLHAYPFDGTTLSAPVSAVTGAVNTNQIAVRPGDAHVAIAQGTAPFLSVFPWSGTAFGAAITPSPALPGAGSGNTAAWRPDGAFVALGRSVDGTNPQVVVYPFDGAALGTAITLASTGQRAQGLAWSPDGAYLLVAWETGNALRVSAYSFNGVTLGPAIEPASKPDGVVSDVAFSPDGNWVAIATADSGNKLWVYPWNAPVFGTPFKRATPQATRIAWAPDQAFLGVSIGASPFVAVIGIFATGAGSFGAQTNFIVTGTPAAANDVTFSADGAFAAAAYDGTTMFGAFAGTRTFGF